MKTICLTVSSAVIILHYHHMSQQLAWIYISDICLSIVNFALILVVFGLLFKHWGTYHRNFWFILFQIHVAFFGIIAGNILAATSMQMDDERPLEKMFLPWKMGNFWSSFSGSFLEAGFYSLFIERSLATIKRSNYESITSFWFTAFLSGLSLIYSLAISSMWHILPLFLVVIDISVSIPISFGLNLLCAMCVVLLSYYNRQLRKKELGTMCDLSQRYQIDENIKLLNQWLPVLFFGSVSIITNGIFSICGYSFDIGINNYDNTMIYMMGLNIYVFIACLIIIRTDGVLIQLLSTWLNFSPSTVIPRNVLGQEIIVSHITVEQHFTELKRYWN